MGRKPGTRTKRRRSSVRAGMLLRLLAMVFLPGLGFAALGKYFPSGGSAVSPLFIAIVSVMGIAEIAIAVSAVRLWLGHYKEEEKEE